MMQQLVSLALIGTANAPQDPTPDAAFQELLALMPEASREQRLLWLAGSAAVYGRAGAMAAQAIAPAPAPDDALPAAPVGTQPLLHAAITGQLDALAPWMAQRLQQARTRLPEVLLPTVLGLRDRKQLSPWIPVLGERGRWLSSLNEDWARLLAVVSADALTNNDAELLRNWEEGSNAVRRAALTAQRERDPAIARTWIAAVLPKEKAEQRQQWVEALATKLSHDDTDLLEQQLDDRSQGVRAAAAALLARLPASACATRLRERFDACIRWQAAAKPSGLGRLAAMVGVGAAAPQLLVEPPAELPKEWERDGIIANPPPGEGKRAFWLRQLTGLIPPAHWSKTADATPAELLPVLLKNEWAEALMHGLAAATCRFTDADWAAALLAQQAASPMNGLNQYESDLWQVLPEERRRDLIRARLEAGDQASAFEGLRHCAAPWPAALARQAIKLLAPIRPAALAPDKFQVHALALEQCLVCSPDEVLPELNEPIRACKPSTEPGDWSANMRHKLADRLVALLDAKLQFIKEMPL